MDDDVKKLLLKRAKGFMVSEVQEEYAVKDDGELALTKRKVSEKFCPPDTAALKTYLELSGERGPETMSDEQLEAERKRLLAKLKQEEKQNRQKGKKPTPKGE